MSRPLIVLESFWPNTGADTVAISSAGDWAFLQNISSGLVELSGANSVRPGLSNNWTCSSDGLSWIFDLRAGLRWSDGSLMTADQIVWSLRRSVQGTAHSKLYRIVSSISAISERQIAFQLLAPLPQLLLNLAFVDHAVVHPSAVSKNGLDWEGPCSGCFKLEYYSSERIELRSNPHHYSDEPYRPKLLHLERASGDGTDLQRLSSGCIDIFQTGPGQVIGDEPELKHSGFKTLQSRFDFTFVLLFHRRKFWLHENGLLQRRKLFRTVKDALSNFSRFRSRADCLRPPGLMGSLAENASHTVLHDEPLDPAAESEVVLKILVQRKHQQRPYVLELISSLEKAGHSVEVLIADERRDSIDIDYDVEVAFLGASEEDPDSVWRFYNQYFGEAVASDAELDQAQQSESPDLRNQIYQDFERRALHKALFIPIAYSRSHIITREFLGFDTETATHWGLDLTRVRVCDE